MILRYGRELFEHRGFISTLLGRELSILYRRTFFGFLWTLLNPLLHVATYSVIYYLLIRPGMPDYPVFLLCGVLPWFSFSASLSTSPTAIIDNGWLVKNVPFPLHVLPTVSVLLNFVHFALSLPCLLAMMLLAGAPIGWQALLILPVMAVQFLFTEAVVLILSVLHFRFRDIRYMIPNLASIWFILTPILYPVSDAPPAVRPFFLLNPMAPIVMAFQDALYYRRAPAWQDLGVTLVLSLAMLAAGVRLFESRKWAFAEGV